MGFYQINSFKVNGYAIFHKFFNTEELQDIKLHVLDFILNCVPHLPENRVYYDEISNKESLKQIQMMFEYDDYFYELINKSKIYKIAEKLIGEKPNPVNLQYFNKAPTWSKSTPPHQDGFYFKIKPVKAITLWLAMDDVDEKNGGLTYFSGSHHQGLRPHQQSGVLGFSQGLLSDDPILKESKGVCISCSAGTLLAHDPLTIHSAEKNQSTRPRRALGFIYYASSVENNKSSAAEYQKKLDQKLKVKGLI